MLTNGQYIGHYRILSALGAGGMGEVYLTEDTRLDRQVALKILPPEFAKDKERMNRFVREAKSASALNHPNIITIHEIGEADGIHFIATEFIEGLTLKDYAKANSLNEISILEIAVQVASGLDEAHTAGIVHRDIKPDNLMIRPNGLVKILDFGIAKLSGPAVSNEEAATAIEVTSPGMIIGTPSYMSPEQAKGKAVDARSDIFSFGVVLYEMISGKLPFAGETSLEVIVAILHKEPMPLKTEVPAEIRKIISKCLSKERDERYQTIRNVANDLKQVKQELEFQNKSEQAVATDKTEQKTQILPATTTDHPNQTTNQAVSNNLKTKHLVIGLALILILVLTFLGSRYFMPTKQIESIAVMPFVNESGNAEVEYLSDGMTETLISSLTNVPNLNVKARSSVFRYKGQETDLKTIGKELNVQAILTGRVVQRGDQLKLSLELVDVATENALWSQQYNRRQSDLVSLQSEIARDVSSKLKAKLSSADAAGVGKNHTTNPEAYRLYLQGRFHWNKRDKKEFEKAIAFFKQAIENDPKYSLAYSGLADTLVLFPNYGNFRPKDYLPQAKEAALKALELDPDLAEAHSSLGQILFYWDYDWAGAEREHKRAIDLNPKYPTAHQWYAELLSAAGRHDEAIKEISKALELDPVSLVINQNMIQDLYFAGRYDEALLHIERFSELFPNAQGTHLQGGRLYAAQGKYAKAVEEYLAHLKQTGIKPERIQKLKESFEKSGWDGFGRAYQEFSLETLQTTQETDRNGYVKSSDFALAYAFGKDKDKCIEYLNKAYDERLHEVLFLKEIRWDFLRDDPRFKELVRKAGIPE